MSRLLNKLRALDRAPAQKPATELPWATPDDMARAAGLLLDPYQVDVVRSPCPRIILNCSRQSGKSTTGAVRALWTALRSGPSGLVLVAAATERQAFLLVDTARSLARTLGIPLLRGGHHKGALTLASGARIIPLPANESGIRGFSSVNLLIIDEAARVPDDLFHALLPMLAVSRGHILLLSNPGRPQGFFHRIWTQGGPAWERTRRTAHDNPRISPEFLEEQRAHLPSWVFSTEYLCEFAGSGDDVFPADLLNAWLEGTL